MFMYFLGTCDMSQAGAYQHEDGGKVRLLVFCGGSLGLGVQLRYGSDAPSEAVISGHNACNG